MHLSFVLQIKDKIQIKLRIKRVVYLLDKYRDSDSSKASRRMLDDAGVIYEQFESDKEIVIKF